MVDDVVEQLGHLALGTRLKRIGEQRERARGNRQPGGLDEPRGLGLQPLADALEPRAQREVPQLLHDVVDHVGSPSFA